MKKFFSYFFSFFFILILIIYIFDYGYILRGLKSTYLRFEKSAQVDDSKFFYNDTIKKSNNPFIWPKSVFYNKKPLSKKLKKTLENYKTHSFLVIQNDSIILEKYWPKWSVLNNKSNSFSIAKSIVSLVVAMAVDDGYLKSFDKTVKSVFPEMNFFKEKPNVTIGDLLNMSSGLNWNEKYFNPFNITARSYMTKDLYNLTLSLDFNSEPNKKYVYQSGNTQLASLMLDKILKDSINLSFSDYVTFKFWNSLGAEEDALWSLDNINGVEKSFCCFHSNAKDFAKIGKLFLNKGYINDSTLIIKNWYFDKIFSSGSSDFYSYGWWKTNYKNNSIFYMRGFRGQFVVVVPKLDLIIVRLGRKDLRNRENPDLPSIPFEIYVSEIIDNYI